MEVLRSQTAGAKFRGQKGKSPDRQLRSPRDSEVENDVKMQRQPGCWLRSSHTLKECVTAHWSSEFARKITGAKLSTEIADCSTFNNMYRKEYILLSVLQW